MRCFCCCFFQVAKRYKDRVTFEEKNLVLNKLQTNDSGYYQCKTMKNQEVLDGNRLIKLVVYGKFVLLIFLLYRTEISAGFVSRGARGQKIISVMCGAIFLNL